MDAFIQREAQSGVIAGINYFAAYQGLRELGYHLEIFVPDELAWLPLKPNTLVVGGIGTVLSALHLLGIVHEPLISVPRELQSFAGRRLWNASLGQVRALFDGRESEPVFIKPMPRDFKLFGGHVVAQFGDLLRTCDLPSATLVQCAEVVPLVVEYRCFVHRGEIIGCKHYAGDFRLAPDWTVIDAAFAAYYDCPIGCSLDFGVTRDGRTLLVEVNDGFSLGHYGLTPIFYAQLLADRWQEITQGYQSQMNTET